MPSEVEIIKENSNYLRGTIKESLANEITGALAHDDVNLIKLHGSYQQFDRDLESERKKQKLEPLYSFMTRIRLAGGIATPQQWLTVDDLSVKYANGTIKLTTRQAFQLHGLLKRNLKSTIQVINNALMNTIAACGDVNRNVMCNPNPFLSSVHAEVQEYAQKISDHLTPRTTAYHEIWLDKQLLHGGEQDEEPIYGKTYLPRKFKIAIAIPPYNDSDIFSNDLGLIAIENQGLLEGFNVAVGGGLGMTFGNNKTYPRLADIIGYIPKEKVVDVAEKIIIVQRNLGNREDRKNARLKYTIDRIGIEQFKEEVYKLLGYKLEEARPYQFISSGDTYGWKRGSNGNWHLTLFIEGGRVRDTDKVKLKSALRQIATIHTGDFRLTGNQNLIIANIAVAHKKQIEKIFADHNVLPERDYSGLRLNSIACVALNTCSLAFAEAERYLPSLIDKLDTILIENGIEKEPILIRMTGCPNGCGRPYLGEIAFVGKAPGRYNIYLGAGFTGERLNKLYKENLNEQEILDALRPVIEDFAKSRLENEKFGDFVIRKNYVKETTEGLNFHS
ncbi:MAG: assimilatory sulfite reductase (NADPH) hemoprotein subunit [Candidatus Babeliaceae bacterium]|nr:assimilatory sulfite reductase (NADPH) hemoprotein subunit [Candidatus Babeliaceae bacterium]